LAAPCVVGRRNSSTPLVHYGLTVRKTAEVSLGTLPDEGVLRLKYRMREPAPLFLMLSVHKPSGAFGGNFEHKMASEQSRGAEAGWQVLEIPLASFDSVIPRYPTIAPESRPNLIMITTFEKDCGLEVAEISISATEAAQE
jgi:hypothetical protein